MKDTPFRNQWPVWGYPHKVSTDVPDGILVADRYDDAVRERLAAGGTVLLTLPPDAKTDGMHGVLSTRFQPIFWSYLWRNTRHGSTMGLLCDPGHPALEGDRQND